MDEESAVPVITEIVDREEYSVIPTWLYIVIFTIPAIFTYWFMRFHLELDSLLSTVTSLAVMNGSINSIIAWLTIRLDGQSAEALEHLDSIMSEMDRLENTLDQANERVESFTTDLDEARGLFRRVGVSLDELDLEPIAEVVEKLKENKDGLNDILDNLRDVDIEEYINQAKRIEWKQLLNSAEEIMGFIKSNQNEPISIPTPSISMPKLPILPTPPEPSVEEILGSFDDDDDDWFDDEEDDFFEPEPPAKNLTMKRNKSRNLKMKR